MTATETAYDPSSMELRCAERIRSHDDHALIGVENALAAGATPESLGLTVEEIHQARVRFVKHELSRFIFEQSDKYFSRRSRLYLLLEAVKPEEVSGRPEDHRIFDGFLVPLRHENYGQDTTQEKQRIESALRSAPPIHQSSP